MTAYTIDNEAHLTPAEREYVFARAQDDDFYTLDIAKCSTWSKDINRWKKAAEERPDKIYIQFEDSIHIIIKAHKSEVRMPAPKSQREFSEEHKQKLQESRIKRFNNGN